MQKGFSVVNLHGTASGVIAVPVIGDNGHWWVGNDDTGVKAQGPVGETGPKGDTGEQGPKGDPGPGTEALEERVQKIEGELNQKVDDSDLVFNETQITSFPFSTIATVNGNDANYVLENNNMVIVQLNIHLDNTSPEATQLLENLGTKYRIDSVITDSNGVLNKIFTDNTGRLFLLARNIGNRYFTGSIVIPK